MISPQAHLQHVSINFITTHSPTIRHSSLHRHIMANTIILGPCNPNTTIVTHIHNKLASNMWLLTNADSLNIVEQELLHFLLQIDSIQITFFAYLKHLNSF
jgi:hypothetical protein